MLASLGSGNAPRDAKASTAGGSASGGGGGPLERVVLTDIIPATLENLRRNASHLEAPGAATRCHIVSLDWRQSPRLTADAHADVDLLLAADCVYDPEMANPLLATIEAVLTRNRNRGARALIAAERRGAAWQAFEAALADTMKHSHGALQMRELSGRMREALGAPGCPFWCAADSVERLVLLELAALPEGRAPPVAPLLCVANGASADGGCPWRVEAKLVPCRARSLRLRIRLTRELSF